MRIGLDIAASVARGAVQGGKAERKTSVTERVSIAADEAQISADRATIQALGAELGKVPEMRLEKVERLRRSIVNGDYRVSAEQIAEAVYRELAPYLKG